MNADLQSVLIGTAGLLALAIASIGLTAMRSPAPSAPDVRRRLARLTLIGAGVHSLHTAEEYWFGFRELYPLLLGLEPWPHGFFIGFNLFWIVVWLLSAPGVSAGFRPAYFPVWFMAMAMAFNGLAHPALAVAYGGYFPGLWTSPIEGVLGVTLALKLWTSTSPQFKEGRP